MKRGLVVWYFKKENATDMSLLLFATFVQKAGHYIAMASLNVCLVSIINVVLS